MDSPAAVIIEDLLVKELVDVADVMLVAMVAALWALAPDIVTVDEDIHPRLSRLESIEELELAEY